MIVNIFALQVTRLFIFAGINAFYSAATGECELSAPIDFRQGDIQTYIALSQKEL